MNLMPCPFCGATEVEMRKGSNYYVECTKCGTYGPDMVFSAYDKTQIAIKETLAQDLWNKRYEEKK